MMDFFPLFFFVSGLRPALAFHSPTFPSLTICRRTSHLLRRINALKANWCFHAFHPTTFGHFASSFFLKMRKKQADKYRSAGGSFHDGNVACSRKEKYRRDSPKKN